MIKTKDGYGKLIGSSYNGDATLVLLSNGGNIGYAIPSTGNTLVQRNTSGQIESSVGDTISPFKITSVKVNENLNSDLLDGFHAAGLFQSLTSTKDKNLTIKIGDTELSINDLYATFDAAGNNIMNKYVTTDTTQNISGTKTFTTLLKFTYSGGAPFTVSDATVVTNLNADLLDGTHKSGLFTDFSNVTSGTDANKLSITIGGTTKKVLVNYAQNAGSIGGVTLDNLFTALTSTPAKNLSATIGGITKDITSLYSNYWVFQAIGSKNFNDIHGDTYRGTSWYGGGSNTATNNPLGNGSAFGMQVWRNASGYTAQLIMSSAGRMYIRYYNGTTWSTLKTLAFTSDLATGGSYWADLPVLTVADATTTPTFAEATATTQVTTPKVHSTGRLTLNATSTALDLKYNNDDTKSVILNGTEFKPFDAANGNLDLGASDARWKGLYAGTGDFTGVVRTTGEGFYLASSGATYSRSRWISTNDGIWIQAATATGTGVKGTLWITGYNNNNLTALKIKADNTDFNGTIGIASDGKIAATNTGSRQAGMYGIYDSTKVGHIWSMGTGYVINANGSNTGNLYGLAYFHTNWSNDSTKNDATKTEVSTYAGNHLAAWVINGKVHAALGNYVWSRNGFIKHGSDNTYALMGGGGHKAIGNVQNTAFYKRETSVNGTVWNMAGTTNSAAFTIYAPTTAGTSGYLLKSNGTGAPVWMDPTSLSIGNADSVDGYHALKSFSSAAEIDNTAFFWTASGAISDVSSMSYAALLNVVGNSTRRWQIWNSRNDHLLYWRPEKADYSGYADVHILLDNYNFKEFIKKMYWANILVSDTSSTTTSPTFANNTLSGKLTFTTAAATASISFKNGELIDGYGNVLLGTNSASWNVFDSSRNSLLTVLKNGNVGIGINPSYKLHVNGTAQVNLLRVSTANQYREAGGIILNNSDIWGLNAIYTLDLADSASEGYLFKRTNSNYDSLWCKDGVFYFSPNGNATDGYGTTYIVLHSGNSSVSGGGSSVGSSITVNIGGTSKTLTIPSTSTYTNYLKIHDVRGTNHLPNSTTYPAKYITAWFNNTGTPDSSWWSGITVKGWADTYAVWQLCSYSSTGTANNYRLYHRNGINGGWGSWKAIAYTSDIPSIPSISISNSGSGNAVTSITASGHTLTVTKGKNFFTHLGTDNKASVWSWGTVSGTSGWNSTASDRGYRGLYGTNLDISGFSTWYHRFAMCTDGRVEYWLGINTKTLTKRGVLAWTSDIPNPANYYWANVRVSASSSTSTYPTFANMKSTGRIYLGEWIEFSGATGLYWPNAHNATHLYPNNTSTYGNLKVLGSKGSYTGFHLGSSTSYMTVMSTDTHHGLYCENTGLWEFYYNRSSKGAGILTSTLTKTINLAGTTYISGKTWIGTTSGGEMLNVGGWVGTTGKTGWYNISYTGGIYMEDSTWVRIYNNKKFYVANSEASAIHSAGGVYVAGAVHSYANYLKSTCNGKTITIGSQNASWCHYSTDAPAHWFNKPIYVQGHIYGGSSYNRRLAYVDELPTNTWRGIENVLTSTSTSNSLTANMGRVLANGGSDRPIVLLAGTLYRSGAGSSYTTWYFTGYRHRSISSTNPTISVSGGVARFYFTATSGYGFSFALVCANHQASGEATAYTGTEYKVRSSGLYWFGTHVSGQYLYIRSISLGDQNNDTAISYAGQWTSYGDGVTRVSIIAVGYAW